MKTIETDLVVTSDGRANVLRMPPGIRDGKYNAVLVINDEPLSDTTIIKGRALRLSRYPIGVKEQAQTFRREDLYGGDGR